MSQDIMPSPRSVKGTFTMIVVVALTFAAGSAIGFAAGRMLPGPTAPAPNSCDAEGCDLPHEDGSWLAPATGSTEKVSAVLFSAETADDARFAVAEGAFWHQPDLLMMLAPPAKAESKPEPAVKMQLIPEEKTADLSDRP